MPKKLVLIVVDGMTPEAFEHAVESGRAPALALPRARTASTAARRPSSRRSRRSASARSRPAPAPTSITSPRSSWWNRQEKRIVEYGSSFAALRKAGFSQAVVDTIVNMNERHLVARRDDGVRGARGRGLRRRRDQHHVLPRPAPPPADRSRAAARGARAEPLLLLQPLRVGPDGRAVRRPRPQGRSRSTPTRPASGAGS